LAYQNKEAKSRTACWALLHATAVEFCFGKQKVKNRRFYMTFAEKLKSIRKQAGMSQEQLTEKLGVSRQAVTKWETDSGIPDIENMMAISALFDISIDELLSNEKGAKEPADYFYESTTEYDIDEPKRYDMKFGGAKQFTLSGYDGEKIRVRLVSNTMPTIQNDFKVRIDDIRKRIDVDVSRKNGVTEAMAKEAVSIFVQIPTPYIGKIECAVNAETVGIHSLECESIELDMKTPDVILADVTGTVEIKALEKTSYDVLKRMGSIIEFPTFYDHMSGKDNLQLHCEYMGYYNKGSVEEALGMLGLSDAADKPAGSYSLGMKQIRDLFRMLCTEYGMTFMISNHLLPDIESIADTVGVIHHGKMMKEISMKEIAETNTAYIELLHKKQSLRKSWSCYQR
jgi:transcriptional regulator with XRE-family HTH domain